MTRYVFDSKVSYAKSFIENVKFDYKDRYPEGIDLDPKSDSHSKLLAYLGERAAAARNSIATRFDSWRTVDSKLTGYIDLSTDEKKVKEKDIRNPVSIVIPVTYATLDTYRTFLASAFLNDPVFRYNPQDESDVVGAALMERLIQSHTHRFNVTLPLMTLWRDGLAYDFGMVHPIWKMKRGKRKVRRSSFEYQDPLISSIFAPLEEFDAEELEDTILFEGNALMNIDPYQILPDPGVPLHRLQEGTFIGFTLRSDRLSMLETEAEDEDYFNCRYLKYIDGRSYFIEEFPDGRDPLTSSQASYTSSDVVDLTYIYAKIIPEEIGLSGYGEYPQKWMFVIAGDTIIVCAQPLELLHGMYPAVPCTPNYDGHTMSGKSKLEMMSGLQHMTDFICNSRWANVRKSLNNMWLVDPQMVNMTDITNPQEGLLVRMRPFYWGKRAVKDAMMQFPVSDVTASNIGIDLPNILALIERTTGATENLQGLRRTTSERVTASEANTINRNALGRMEATARIISAMTMQPLAYIYASHAQQFMEKGQYVKITGRYEQDLRSMFGQDLQMVPVTPDSINVDLDIEEHDGSIPGSGDPNIMLQMFQIAASNPAISMSVDLLNMMAYVAKISGAKNFQDFVKATKNPPVIMSDQQVENGVQAGNVVPMQEAMNL